MNDPIVEEVRAIRDAHAAEFDYDLDAIYRDIKEREKASGRTYLNYGPQAPKTETSPQTALPARAA